MCIMKNKGFTLIELLAVIVLLAIIFSIVVISVEGTINNSESKLSKSQIKNIEEAAESYYIEEGMNQNEDCVNLSYLITKGYLDGDEIKDPKTKKVMNGSVKITLNGNQYSYKYSSSACAICFGVESASTYIASTDGGYSVSTKVPLGNYLPGDEYICQVNDSQTQHFIVMNTEGDKVNLLMTYNIDSTGTAVTETTGTNERVRWNSTWDRTLGPVSAMELLNKATSNWTNIPMLNETYNDEGGNFTNYKITGRARLPKVSELKSLGDFACINYSNGDDKWFDGVYGYWTLSSSREYEHAAMVINNGCSVFINSGKIFGVRPVITLDKSSLN